MIDTRTTPMRVVALFRVSTEKQASEGASLDAQQRIYREMAAERGWSTIAEFRGCESATQAASDRRVLQQVLACVRDEAPDAIYVHEQSRLTRGDELDVALLMRELRERRAKIIVNGVVRDLSSIDERFMVGIQSLVDRAESERIKERMKRGRLQKAREGKKTCGKSTYGYRNPPPGFAGRGTLHIVPEEAPVVRRIFEMASRGKGFVATARELNSRGIPAPRGGKWAKSSVRRILQNPAYLGIMASNVWIAEKGSRTFRFRMDNPDAIVVENAHEAIIDRALWDAVHGRKRPLPTKVPRLLTGLLYVDGTPMSGDSHNGGTFYRGPRGRRKLPWIESKMMDETVWSAFVSLACSPDLVERLMAGVQSPHERMVTEQEITYLTEQVGKQQRRLERLVTMRADGEIDRATFVARSDEARAAIESLEAELKPLRAKTSVLNASSAQRVAKAVQCLVHGSTKLETAQRRSILESIVRRIDVTAIPTGALQKRVEGGRLSGSGGPKWAIKNVTFQLDAWGMDQIKAEDSVCHPWMSANEAFDSRVSRVPSFLGGASAC